MNNIRKRRLVAEFAVGLMVCGAAYYFLVEPANRRLAQARANIDLMETGGTANPAPILTDDQVQSLFRTTASRSAEISKRSGLARDEARMFAAVMSLAGDHNVRVDQLQPVEVKTDPVAAKPDQPTPGAPATQKDSRAGYSLTVQGTYSDLSQFLRALSTTTGYTVIRSVRINPGEPTVQTGMVIARIETEAYSFDLAALNATHPGARPVTGAPGGD